jgi:hypothetical protein
MQCHTTTRICYTRMTREDRKAKTPGTFAPLPRSISQQQAALSNITTRQFIENSLEA